MTAEEYAEALAACNWNDESAVSALITDTYTERLFNKGVIEIANTANPGGAPYFANFFGTEVWPDGVGQTFEQEVFYDPYIPLDFRHFVRTMQVCDPNTANECLTDYCELPEGGRGVMPGLQMYKSGFKTNRDCIANIRHIRDFMQWSQRSIRSKGMVDEYMRNMFGMMAVMNTLAHKVVLQGQRDSNGNLVGIANSNPRNPFRGYLYNYLHEKFPTPTDPSAIMPLTLNVMQHAIRYWDNFGGQTSVGKGDRGENIYEFWYADDWYYDEVIRDADWSSRLEKIDPKILFAGRSTDAPVEVLAGLGFKTMRWLPRYTLNSEGGLEMLDTHQGVDVATGQQFVGSIDWENAPFSIAMSPSPNQGRFLTRPDLTTSGQGIPILPITGNGAWRMRNEYDRECNPEQNMPYWSKRYEMGFRWNAPEGLGIIYRRRKFRVDPINDCDLADIFVKPVTPFNCDLSTVGCDNKRRADNSITETGSYNWVECVSNYCGVVNTYALKLQRSGPGVDINAPDYNFLGCECGSTVMLRLVNESDLSNAGQVPATLINIQPFPQDTYIVRTTAAIPAGQCIKGIMCGDGTPLSGVVETAIQGSDIGTTGIIFILNSPIDCGVGGNVRVSYHNAAGQTINTVTGQIAEADPATNRYRITSADPDFKVTYSEDQASITIGCAGGASNSTSSSSSSSGEPEE